jgi:CpXC protein
MSRSTILRLTCTCGEPVTITVYDYVNVAQDPLLRYTVLVGLLNTCVCLACGRRTVVAHPFIYSDPSHQLLAYVHPRGDAPEEARMMILERLRETYLSIVEHEETKEPVKRASGSDSTSRSNGKHHSNGKHSGNGVTGDNGNSGDNHSNGSAKESSADALDNHTAASEIPPLQVIFGIEQLSEVINASLSQDERLGKLALSTQSQDEAERGQMLIIARKLAQEMQCQVEVEDLPGEYTVWLFGPRRQIGAIMRELAARS